jgi:2'-5' RNA ligase
MADNKNLYFIALLPSNELTNKIDLERKSFSEKYQSFHALKTAPHVTLIAPFKRAENFEVEMHLQIQDFFTRINSFQVSVNGYGCFQKNNKVIFFKVEKSKELIAMHRQFVYFLRMQLNFSEKETSYMYHPHITIAHRDLTDDNFEKAWSEYEAKKFNADFLCHQAYLLKHNYSKWEVLSVFNFINDGR